MLQKELRSGKEKNNRRKEHGRSVVKESEEKTEEGEGGRRGGPTLDLELESSDE